MPIFHEDFHHPSTGLGSYTDLIRLYQSHLTDQRQIGHAHSDYLELACELGLPMAGLWVALVLGVLVEEGLGSQELPKIQSFMLKAGRTA